MNTSQNQGIAKVIAYIATVAVFMGVLGIAGGVLANKADETLLLLEENYKNSSNGYDSQMQMAIQAIEAVNDGAKTQCSAYRALKAYKESKGYEIKDPTNNPCTQKRGFMPTETIAQ